MDGLLQDLRYVLRTLIKRPAFVTISVLTRSGVFELISVAIPASQALSGGDGVELGRTPRV